MNVLVVAAHPDDEVLGCGGTIAKLSKGGDHVHIALLGEGITSRFEQRSQVNPQELTKLHDQSRRVAELVGARDLSLHGLPDNRFDTVPLLEIIQIVEKLIRQFQPQAIYTHHGGDLNVDHAVTSRAVLTATRPMPDSPVREIYSFEVPSSTEWTFGQLRPEFCPNVFVNITETLGIKIQAMQLYTDEVRSFPHPRSPEAISALARARGIASACEAAEAFALIRSLK